MVVAGAGSKVAMKWAASEAPAPGAASNNAVRASAAAIRAAALSDLGVTGFEFAILVILKKERWAAPHKPFASNPPRP